MDTTHLPDITDYIDQDVLDHFAAVETEVRGKFSQQSSSRVDFYRQKRPSNFIWVNIRELQQLCQKLNDAIIPRLLVLMTFINTSNVLGPTSKTPLSVEQFTDILNISERNTADTLKALVDAGALTKGRPRSGKPSVYKVSRHLVRKGKLANCGSNYYAKMFIDSIRSLYGTDDGEMFLRYLPDLTEHIKMPDGVFCKYPMGADKSRCYPLTMDELIDLIQVPRRKQKETAKKFMELRLNADIGGSEMVLLLAKKNYHGFVGDSLVLNPRIITTCNLDDIQWREEQFVEAAKLLERTPGCRYVDIETVIRAMMEGCDDE